MTYGEAPKPGAAKEGNAPSSYLTSLRINPVEGGIPIATVYSGYKTSYNFAPISKARQNAFKEAAMNYRFFEAATAIHNPYVPPRRGPKGGIDRQRRVTAVSDVFGDPMEVFKVQRFKSTKLNDPSRLTYKSGGPSRWEKKGLAAYRSENPANREEDY